MAGRELLPTPSVLSNFDTDHRSTDLFICCVGLGQAWARMSNARILQLIEYNGAVKDTISVS